MPVQNTSPAAGNTRFVLDGARQDSDTPIQPTLVQPAAPAAPAALSELTQAQVDQLAAGFEQTFMRVEDALVAQVFGDSLPLLGDRLASAAAGGAPALHYVTALKAGLNNGLATLTGAATYTEAQVELALRLALDAAGIASGAGPQLDFTNPNDIKLTSNSSKSFAAFDSALDVGLGLPGLGIQASGTAHTAINYTLNFGVGLDASGFYLNTADGASVFRAGFTTTVPGLDVAANLSQLHFRLTDESATDGDGVAPTAFTGSFAIDLLDPGSQGADDRLRIGELTAGADLLNATLTGNANVNLNLRSDLGTAVLPEINADLNLAWGFNGATVIAGDANTGFGLVPQVAFRNVKLDLGSFFSDFAAPVLQKVQVITEPLQPIFDALTDDIPALADLVNASGLAGAVPTTLIGLLRAGGQVSPEAEARILLLDGIVSFVNSVPADGGGALIDLGDFNLGATDPRQAGFQLANTLPNEIRHAVSASLQSEVFNNFQKDAGALPGGGMSFPIIENPQTAFGLLLGRPVDFFIYDAPDFVPVKNENGNPLLNEFFPVLGPLGIRLKGDVDALAKLDFGYDTQGLIEYAAAGSNDPSKIFNGFYVVDQDGPEALLDASLEAFLAINLGFAEAGAGGGVLGHVEMGLDDPTPGDNKLRVSEIIAGLSDGCLVDFSGKITAGLSAYLTVGWSPFSHSWNYNGPSTQLLNFDGTSCDATGHGNDQPVLARTVGANLSLNIGLDAPLRIRGDNTDTIEFFAVEHVSGAAGGEVVRVLAFSLAPQRYTLGSGGEIRATGGVLEDSIRIDPAVLTRAVLHGGDGNDQVWGGAGADALFGDAGMDFLGGGDGADSLDGGIGFDLLDGMAGNDLLRGGADADILIGGPGADRLEGNAGTDTSSYITSAVAVLLDLATPTASTGDAAGDVFVSIEHFYGSGFNDTLRGSSVSNYLAGDRGNDLIEGGGGRDLLIGGAGADTLNGGSSADYASYIDGRAAVNVSLLTGIGSGGFAQGDLLISIENLEGADTADTAGAPGDVLEGNGSANEIRGLGGADTLRGLGGNDLLSGGLDSDLLDGGTGNDTLLGEFGDDTLLGGTGLDSVSGGDGSDSLAGGDGADTLLGDEGADWLDGGAGDDLLDGGAGGDTLSDLAGNNQLLGGADDDLLTAGAGNDGLAGGTGGDTLAGGDGANTLSGGDGDDVLVAGTDGDSLDGGKGNDTASSGAGNDTLVGGYGNDVLDGGTGNERVEGGVGNDLLSVGALRGPTQDPDRLDHIFGGDGVDALSADFSNQTAPVTIVAGVTQSLVFADGTEARDFENVHDLFTGSADDSVRLDGAADDGFANLLKTAAGDDTLYSGAGSDNVDAGDGDDFVNGGTNDAVIAFSLGFGNVTGFTGPAETLAGGAGIDTLSFEGFSGLFPNNVARGRRFGVVINLATNLTGGAATGIGISGFENIIGTDYGDELTGDAGPNLFQPLRGGGNSFSATTGGPDRIDGAGGEDTLRIDFSRADVANSLGIVTNGSTIYRNTIGNLANVDNYSYTSIEHLDLTGASQSDSLYATVYGFGDVLSGLGGNDSLGGYGGADTLLGGDGNDVLAGQGKFYIPALPQVGYDGIAGGHDVFYGGAGDDLVEDIGFNGGSFPVLDAGALFRLDGGTGFDTLSADFSNQAAPIIWNSTAPTNIEFSDGAYARNFERLRWFATGAGNDAITQGGRVDNIFHLGAGNDTVNSGIGLDTVDGGTGLDLAILDFSVGDSPGMAGVQGGGNPDGGTYSRTVADLSSRPDNIFLRNFERVKITGSSKNDSLVGTYGNDSLIGGDGNDLLDGNSGGNNFLDGGNGDDVLKGSYGINGTGANDRMYGRAGNDILSGGAGDDTLDGGAGADTLIGGDGSDTSYVDNPGDLVTETNANVATGGNDTVYSNLAAYTLTANVENLHILATGLADGTGNSLDNTLYAGGGNNRLDGSSGTDTVSYADAVSGVIVSLARSGAQATGGSGSDTLVSIENLAGSSANDRLTGNGDANALNGGPGNDTLSGGAGADTVTGGAGADRFKFANTGEGGDSLTDFASGSDKIQVVSANFGTLPVGLLDPARFVAVGTALTTGDAVFIYAGATGALAFDSDGNGAAPGVQIATLTGPRTLEARDFQVVAV